MLFSKPSPSISESMVLGPSSRYNPPLINCKSLSLSKSQSQSISNMSIIPSPSSSISSQLEIPSPSQSLNSANDALRVVQRGSGFAGIGLACVGQFQAATSALESSGYESFSFCIWSSSKSYSKFAWSPLTAMLARLSGFGVPPISGSSQSYTAL